jgi:uncharacterized coiled-coil DUF342 family protein
MAKGDCMTETLEQVRYERDALRIEVKRLRAEKDTLTVELQKIERDILNGRGL